MKLLEIKGNFLKNQKTQNLMGFCPQVDQCNENH